MRQQNTQATVPLDGVPERRTERCSPRFRPGGRFLGEPRFRYLSPGREGEKCRPLDHSRQIPFIHSARLIFGSNSYIYKSILVIFSMWYVQVSCSGAYLTIAHVLLQKHSYLGSRAVISLVFSIWHALVHTGIKNITSTHVHSLYKHNSPLSRLDFLFGGSCEDFERLSI